MFGMWIITKSITHGLSCSAERVMEESMKCVARWKVGMPVNARDPHGNTLVMVACQNGQKRIVKLAMRYNAELNLRNRSGNTALHFCFMYAYYNLGEYLISKGADDTIINFQQQNCYEAGESGPGVVHEWAVECFIQSTMEKISPRFLPITW